MSHIHPPHMPPIITNLTGHILLALPELDGSCFERSAVYLCTHTPAGAMGLIINSPCPAVSFKQIAEDMHITPTYPQALQPTIYNGGPIDRNRGIVLHSKDYTTRKTQAVSDTVNLSVSPEVVEAIAHGAGPRHVTFCLGYAGWESGQLEHELAENVWLVVPATEAVLFDTPSADRYEEALRSIGFTPADLTSFSHDIGLA